MNVQLFHSKGKNNKGHNIGRRIGWVATGIFGLSLGFSVQAATLYVNTAASGNNDGSSWQHAYTDLQAALAAAQGGDELWVAAGVYKPVTPSDVDNVTDAEREYSFSLKNGVALYGGFVGNEAIKEHRDWLRNRTILSGDIDDNDVLEMGMTASALDIVGDNSYHVVRASSVDNTAILDGFVITAGMANGMIPNNYGGGIYVENANPLLENLSFVGNMAVTGGGIYNHASSPTLNSVSFAGNSAGTGGGMANMSGSEPVLRNVIFNSNNANIGGGLYNSSSTPTLRNVTLSGNNANTSGGGMKNDDSNPWVYNTIFWNNRQGGDVGTAEASVSNTSSTPTYRNSMIQGCNPGGSWNTACGSKIYFANSLAIDGSNLWDIDPQFVATPDPANAPSNEGNLRLTAASTLIGAGNNTLIGGVSADIAYNTRIVGSNVDLGAYERPSGFCRISGFLHVSSQAIQPGDGWTWDSAFRDLQDALLLQEECAVHVAAGVYKPTTSSDRTVSFELKNNVALYGGFPAGGGDWPERDWQTHRTILSGDIDNNDVTVNGVIMDVNNILGDNSYHVVYANNVDETAVIDGFVVTAGLANHDDEADLRSGAGMYVRSANPMLRNMIFTGNRALSGAGVYSRDSSPTLTNVAFINNLASIPTPTGSVSGSGGGMSSLLGAPKLINVLFSGNRASFGGGMSNNAGSPVLINTTFSANFATSNTHEGGGLINWYGGEATVINSTFWNNRASSDNQMAKASSVFNVDASANISHSLMQGCNPAGEWDEACGIDGGDNLADADPLFLETPDPATAPTAAGNLRLAAGSPAIDAGDSGALIGVLTDLDGNNRIQGDAPDLGAYETTPAAETGDSGDTNTPAVSSGGGGGAAGFGLLGLLGMAMLGRRRLLLQG